MNIDLKKFKEDPFETIDSIEISVKGNNLNIFQKYRRLRYSALGAAIICAVLWGVCGFDSNPLQLVYGAWAAVSSAFNGTFSVEHVIAEYNFYYGKEMHYSAFVIYGLMYYFLSKKYESLGLVNSKNVAYSTGITVLAISIFEFYWIYSYAFWQNQWWVATWEMPQLRILMQNAIFMFAGIITALHMWAWSAELEPTTRKIVKWLYHFRFDKIALVLVTISAALALLWWFYPGYVEPVQVQLLDGNVWHNSHNFPQTLYTIELNPSDDVNAGTWFWIENDVIHGLNTLVKVVWALTVLYIFRLKGVKE